MREDAVRSARAFQLRSRGQSRTADLTVIGHPGDIAALPEDVRAKLHLTYDSAGSSRALTAAVMSVALSALQRGWAVEHVRSLLLDSQWPITRWAWYRSDGRKRSEANAARHVEHTLQQARQFVASRPGDASLRELRGETAELFGVWRHTAWNYRTGQLDRLAVYTLLRRAWACGDLTVGLGQRTLAEETNCTRKTAGRCLDRLVGEWTTPTPARAARDRRPEAARLFTLRPAAAVCRTQAALGRTVVDDLDDLDETPPTIAELDEQTRRLQHDLWSYRGLGRSAGRVFTFLETRGSSTTAEIAAATGLNPRAARRALRLLHFEWSLLRVDGGVYSVSDHDLDQCLKELDEDRDHLSQPVAGTGERRRKLHRAQRQGRARALDAQRLESGRQRRYDWLRDAREELFDLGVQTEVVRGEDGAEFLLNLVTGEMYTNVDLEEEAPAAAVRRRDRTTPRVERPQPSDDADRAGQEIEVHEVDIASREDARLSASGGSHEELGAALAELNAAPSRDLADVLADREWLEEQEARDAADLELRRRFVPVDEGVREERERSRWWRHLTDEELTPLRREAVQQALVDRAQREADQVLLRAIFAPAVVAPERREQQPRGGHGRRLAWDTQDHERAVADTRRYQDLIDAQAGR